MALAVAGVGVAFAAVAAPAADLGAAAEPVPGFVKVTWSEATGGVPVGFREQCAKKRWVTYRSFNRELERTAQFAAMGITNRCFFAARFTTPDTRLFRLTAH